MSGCYGSCRLSRHSSRAPTTCAARGRSRGSLFVVSWNSPRRTALGHWCIGSTRRPFSCRHRFPRLTYLCKRAPQGQRTLLQACSSLC